jgi:hypothetical protein
MMEGDKSAPQIAISSPHRCSSVSVRIEGGAVLQLLLERMKE